MKKKIIIHILIFLSGIFAGILIKYFYDGFSYYSELEVISPMNNGFINEIDVVPDEKTALKIATAIWLPIYGKNNLFWYSYKAELINEELWVIQGAKRLYDLLGIRYGGGPYIEILKKTGQVLNVAHHGVISMRLLE